MSTVPTSTTGSNNSGSPTAPRVHIYIDNSNVYIEGAKTYPSGSYQNTVQDWSWRYDVSDLREVLCNKSGLQFDPTIGVVHTNLYGSEPPPGDIWDMIKSKNVEVHKFERSSWTGKEKQVDMKMGVDITRQATRDEFAELQSEFIVVSGDADLIPSVEAVNEAGFRVHVWAWK